MNHRRRFIILIGGLLVTPTMFGQEQTPTIRAKVRQVIVPVVVTDNKGHYVTDLKASDFQVLEDGVPQTIVAFNTARQHAESIARFHSESASQRSQADPNSQVAVERSQELPSRTYLICIDTLHSSFADFGRVREALKKFFAQEQGGDAQYALIALGREVQMIQDSTRDPNRVLAAIEGQSFMKTIKDNESAGTAIEIKSFIELMKAYCAACACSSTGTTTDAPHCDSSSIRSFLERFGNRANFLDQTFLSALTELVRATIGMPTTRTVVLLSDGFTRFPGHELISIATAFGPADHSFLFNQQTVGSRFDDLIRQRFAMM